MGKGISDEDLELLGQLGVDSAPVKRAAQTPREQRIIAGFEEIERFVKENRRTPQHGEDRDIFERLYAVRLDQIRKSPECIAVLEEIDSLGLLKAPKSNVIEVREDMESNDEALLAALGVEAGTQDDITTLKHVKKKEIDKLAQRSPCKDFGTFKPLFERVQTEVETGERKTIKYQDNAEINKGDLFIVEGQKAYVAHKGEVFTTNYGMQDSRLRVIYDNGTESDLLLRSLQRALNRDETSRRITNPSFGPLFSDSDSDDDIPNGYIPNGYIPSGYIYVLRSNSKEPLIKENRTVIHKIGVTKGSVERRIANAEKDPTYLLAGVEIVAKFKLSNIHPVKIEKLLHRFFASAKLSLALKDRFSNNVEPREWFLVPLPVIAEAIQKLIEGSIGDFRYDPSEGKIVAYG